MPETKYTSSGSVNIAYQVFGGGSTDLVVVPGWVSNIDTFWEEPSVVRFFEGLARFARVILFDKRGTGLSDRVTETPTLEERMDDVRAVLDAVGSDRAALFGYSEGGPMCALYSVTYPERTRALIMVGSYPKMLASADYVFGRSREVHAEFLEVLKRDWGGPVGLDLRAPSRINDARFRQWWAKFLRNSASPSTTVALSTMNSNIDIRNLLGSIQVPTLLIHATGDRTIDVRASRYMAERIPNAVLVELDSVDHLPFAESADEILAEVEHFLTGSHAAGPIDRVVTTIMFTDIVGSTKLAADMGDARWRDLLNAHHAAVRHQLAVYRGKEIKSTGDGFHATFDGPARAIQCGCAILKAVKPMGLSLRVGLHTGECEIKADSLEGLAVHLAARVAGIANADQVVVSQTVKDLVAGSGLKFEDLGIQTFKGVPDPWRLYGVVS
jgi:pimeloyl-ACP methyl ester carboxylesterase